MEKLFEAITKRNENKRFILSGAEYRFIIAKIENEEITDAELANKFKCDKGLISKTRKKLAGYGLVI